MKKSLTLIVLAASLSAFPAIAQHHWGYSGEAGPENWAKIDPNNVMCAIGRNQSPIDLAGFIEGDLKPLKLDYGTHAAEIANHGKVAPVGPANIVNNGHTVQVNYLPGSTLTVDGRAFELKQFHFHSPSENTLAGKSFPLEAHLVHADKEGNLAVVALLFNEGAANPFLAKLWDKVPAKKDDKAALAAGLNVSSLLPASKDYYRFNGSLTTPPCTEGVRWLVMKKQATVSKAQVEQFVKAVGHPNNRPVQSVNARPVIK